jgi:hypothetical protein
MVIFRQTYFVWDGRLKLNFSPYVRLVVPAPCRGVSKMASTWAYAETFAFSI